MASNHWIIGLKRLLQAREDLYEAQDDYLAEGNDDAWADAMVDLRDEIGDYVIEHEDEIRAFPEERR